MTDDKVIKYVQDAIKRGYPVGRILSKLVEAGYDETHMQGLMRETIKNRIRLLSLQREALFDAPFGEPLRK